MTNFQWLRTVKGAAAAMLSIGFLVGSVGSAHAHSSDMGTASSIVWHNGYYIQNNTGNFLVLISAKHDGVNEGWGRGTPPPEVISPDKPAVYFETDVTDWWPMNQRDKAKVVYQTLDKKHTVSFYPGMEYKDEGMYRYVNDYSECYADPSNYGCSFKAASGPETQTWFTVKSFI